jgi:protein-disulfide isomerase
MNLRARSTLGIAVLSAALFLTSGLSAQQPKATATKDWKTSESLPGVDLTGLTAAQKTKLLKLLREQACTCGCDMKLAECRMVDPKCSYSASLAQVMLTAIKEGKSDEDAIAAAKASQFGHPPDPGKILDDPISIPVAGSPVTGPANAPITIVEFSDFQCPYCAVATPAIEEVLRAYPKQVKLIFKEYPLEQHPQAPLAASAALAAFKQHKFWEMHDLLFANNTRLSRTNILGFANQLGLDMKQFETDMNSTEVHETVTRDVQDGDKAGVEGTPTLFVNGQKYNGPISVEALKVVLTAELQHPGAAGKYLNQTQQASN